LSGKGHRGPRVFKKGMEKLICKRERKNKEKRRMKGMDFALGKHFKRRGTRKEMGREETQ